MSRMLFIIILSFGWSFSQDFPGNGLLGKIGENTALDLGDYGERCGDSTGDFDYCKRFGDYSRFTYDSDNHQILFFGGGHSTTMRDDIDVFDFNTLTWTSAYQSTSCEEMTSITEDGTWSSTGHPVARHTYDQLTWAPSAGRLIVNLGVYGAGYCGTYDGCGEWCKGKVHAYDPVTKTWTTMNSEPNEAHVWADEYDPVSGFILSVGDGGLITLDPVADVKIQWLDESSIEGYANNMVYYPTTDRFYYIVRGSPTRVWEIIPDREDWASTTIEEVTGMEGAPSSKESGWAYDGANDIIGGGIQDGVFHAYHPPTKSWKSVVIQGVEGSSAPGTQYSHCLDYDPVNNVFVFLSEDFHTWAYRYSGSEGTAVFPRPSTKSPEWSGGELRDIMGRERTGKGYLWGIPQISEF